MIISIDTEKIAQLVEKADKIFLTPEGENELAEFLTIQDLVEMGKEDIRERLEAAGQAFNPNFSTIQGDKVKVTRREYGAKYTIDPSHAEEVPAEVLDVEMKRTVNTKALEAWANNNDGKLPYGVIIRERPKTISFSFKKEKAQDVDATETV